MEDKPPITAGQGLGCILEVIAFGLLLFILLDGGRIANKILGGC